MDIIASQKTKGASVVMVTHQMEEVERPCDLYIGAVLMFFLAVRLFHYGSISYTSKVTSVQPSPARRLTPVVGRR